MQVSKSKPFSAVSAASVVCAEKPMCLILPSSLGLEDRLHGAARSQRLLDFLASSAGSAAGRGRSGRSPSRLQRSFQFHTRALGVVALRLAGEEIAVAIDALQADSHLDLAFAVLAVGRGDIEVVDPALDRPPNSGVASLCSWLRQQPGRESRRPRRVAPVRPSTRRGMPLTITWVFTASLPRTSEPARAVAPAAVPTSARNLRRFMMDRSIVGWFVRISM